MDVVSFVFNYFKLVALFVCFADSEFGLVFNIYCFIIFDLWQQVCWWFNCLLHSLFLLLFLGELGLGEGRLAVPVQKYPSSPK